MPLLCGGYQRLLVGWRRQVETTMDVEAAKAHSNVAVLLTLSGGFLDAFTFLGHGKVFANSMTGNIVLLAVDLAAGDWHQATRRVSPLAGFVCGILAAHLLQLMSPRWVRQPAIVTLIFEIVFLACGSAERAARILVNTRHFVRRDATNDVLRAVRKGDLHVGNDHRQSAALLTTLF